MNRWDILEIEATNDIAIIKKAYARKLKIYHPEDNPQGYQNLREAYDRAIRYAKYSIQNTEENLEDDLDEDNIINHILISQLFTGENPIDDFDEINDEFMQKINRLYSDFFLRIDIQNWINLFDCEAIWNINNRDNIGDRMLEFLLDHRNIPQNIWIFLDLNFDWSNQERYYKQIYQDTMDYIKGKIQNPRGLGYYFNKNEKAVDYDVYLGYREAAYIAVEEKNLFMASSYLNKAKEIYSSDPDLLLIEGKCLLYKMRYDEALNLFNDLLAKIPNHVEGLLCRSDIYRSKEKYDLAIDDLKKIETCSSNNEEILYKISLCYKELKNFQFAKEYAQRALDTDKSHTKSIDLIEEIDKCLIRNLRFRIMINPMDKSQWKQYGRLRSKIKQSNQSLIIKQKRTIIIKKILLIMFFFIVGIILILVTHLSLLIALLFIHLCKKVLSHEIE